MIAYDIDALEGRTSSFLPPAPVPQTGALHPRTVLYGTFYNLLRI
jgi:hypothetical protein